MQQVISAALYLVVLLRGAFFAGKWYPEGQTLHVSRDERSTMVANNSARDASDEEIAAFRGGIAAEEGASDESSASLEAATAKLKALESLISEKETEKSSLLVRFGELSADVQNLEVNKSTLTGEVSELSTQRDGLTGEVAALSNQKTTLEGEIAALTADKAKAAKAAK